MATERESRAALLGIQVLLVAVVLAAWEFIPRIEGLSEKTNLLDPFFISSPSMIAKELYSLATGSDGSVSMWSYVWPTVSAAAIGTVVGMVLGAALGLVLSNWRLADRVLHPFVIAMNTVPRIALIPIVILLVGPTYSASVVMAITVVLFVAFFNAYEGGRTVTPRLVQNAEVLGASRWQVMIHIRMPYVLAWTLAALPLAVTFAIIMTVTSEILTGYRGLGYLVSQATVLTESALTFAVVVVLAVLGVVVVGGAELVKQRVLHWWGR